MVDAREEHFLWVEKYRPKKIEDTILPKELKQQFQEFIKQENIPNLLLTGSSGVGKTTVARAMLDEIGSDYMIINASLNGKKETLHNEIGGFASTVSWAGGRKYVILDEADHLTFHMQPALRNFMEEFAKNCGFILTCNYKNKILPALHSRCSVVDFTISKKDSTKLAAQFFKRVGEILEAEGVTFDNKVVAKLVQRYYPDWRRTLNELQRLSAGGVIDSSALDDVGTDNLGVLVGLIKDKNYTEARHWVKDNLNSDPGGLMRAFYDESLEFLTPDSIPELVVLLARYQYQSAFAADPEINMMAFLAEVMVSVEFK
jgi:DNA polymerase III delta prime subunit